MIQKDKEEVIREINKNKRKTSIVFWSLIFCTLIVLGLTFAQVFIYTFGVISAVYFLIMTISLLPKINKFNFDINKLEMNETIVVEGDILAVFPIEELKKNESWKILIKTGNKEYVELEVNSEIGSSLNEGDIIKANFTPFNKIIIELTLISKK